MALLSLLSYFSYQRTKWIWVSTDFPENEEMSTFSANATCVPDVSCAFDTLSDAIMEGMNGVILIRLKKDDKLDNTMPVSQ